MTSFYKKETFKNLGFVSIGKGLSVIFGLATISLSAKNLTLTEFGLLALFYSLSELINLISLPGFNTILLKAIHHKQFSFYKKAYLYSFLSSIILGSLLYLFMKLTNFAGKDFKLVIGYTILFVIIRNIEKSECILPGLKKFKALSCFSALSSFVKFLSIGLGAYFFKDLYKSLSIYIGLQSVLSLISFFYISRQFKDFDLSNNGEQFTLESFKMSFLNFFNTGVGQADRLALYSLSPEILAIYQAGISYPEKFREVLKTLLLTITNSWLSFGNNEFKKRVKSNSLVFLSLSIAGALCLYFTADFYIPLLLGAEYSEAVDIAAIMGVLVFLKLTNFFLQARDITFEKLSRHQFKIVSYRIIYLILLFSLITKYEIKGIIITIILSELFYFSSLVYDFIVPKREVLS